MRTLLVSPFPRSFLLLSKLLGGVAVAAIQAYVFLGIFYFWEAEISYEAHLYLLAAPALLCVLLMFNAATDTFPETFISRCIWLTALIEIAALVAVIYFWQLPPPTMNYIAVLPELILAGLMLGSLSLFISSVIKQLENFAGVMNFVIFPMFFASSALYPLWKIRESSPLLYELCRLNPFTYAVELIRFALYGQIGPRLEDGSLDLTNLYVVTGYMILFLGAAIYAYNPSKGLIARRGGPGGGA
jgi:ABC-2 type transport system permease protein